MRRNKVIAILVGALAAQAADPVVFTGDALPGRKARLGPTAPVGVLLDEAGWAMPFKLPPGRVRVTIRVCDNGKGDAVRQRTVSLSVGEQTAIHTVASLGRGLELSADVIHRTAQAEVKLALGQVTETMRQELAGLRGKDALASAPAMPDGFAAAEAPAFALGDEPERTLDLSERQAPALVIETVSVTPLSGPVIVSRVGSDRITYAPGTQGTLTYALENLAGTPQTVDFAVTQLADLDARTPLEAGRIELPARGTVAREVAFAVGDALWGRGFEVIAATPEGADRGAHAVSVVTDPWRVAMHGAGVPMFGSDAWTVEQAHDEAERIARANIEQYNNVYEKFAWAACDYSEMTPEDDATIHSGQTQYTSKRAAYQILHQVFKKYGLHAITYGKACGGGMAGLEYSHRYPERMNIFGRAGFAHESFDVDVIDRMREGRYRQHGRDEDFWQMWISCWTHYGNHATTFYGCDEIAASAKLLGWDGVRYDGEWLVWDNPALSASLVKVTEAHIRKQIPGFAFGYNTIGPRYSSRAGAFTDVGVAAKARGGGLCMDEYYRNLGGSAKGNIVHLQNAGDFIRLHGGTYLCIFDDNTPWNAALVMAAGARPMGGGGSHLRQFATRFSQGIFDPALRRLTRPELFVQPAAELPFAWDAFVYERSVSPQRSELILHLVNVAGDTSFGGQFDGPAKNLNPPQTNLVFELKLPVGYTAEAVFATGDGDTLAPQAARLEGNRMTVPQVRVWTMAVVTLRRAGEVAALHTLCPEPPLVFDTLYGEGGATPRPAGVPTAEVQIAGDLDAEAIQAINACRVKITPEVLDKVLALGLPPDTAPGEELFQAADFAGHRAGRDAADDPAPAAPLTPSRNGLPEILHARGAFSHRHRLYEAFSGLPGAVVDDACVRSTAALGALSAKNPGCLQPWPDRAGLARRDIVVLDAVPAPALSLAQRRDLRDFVAGGGGVMALGSWYSLSKGEYEGSFVEEALPVRCKQTAYLRRIRPEAGGVIFTPAYERILGVTPPQLPAAAAVAWVSPVEPKPGAEVLATTAEGVPVLVAGTFGAGRSLVWAASNSGQPAAPWWESAWWPEVATACLAYLARGAEAVSPPDEALARALKAAREMVEEASMSALLDAGMGLGATADQGQVAERLRVLLHAGTDADARAAVTYLLENADQVDPAQYPELTALAAPRLGTGAEWAALAGRFVKAPPHLLDDLAGELAAVAMPGLKAGEVMRWKVSEIVRLRCLAAAADAAALPFLRKRNAELDAQEAKGVAVDNARVSDLYATRLLRLYVTWALWRCGQRDEATAYQFAKACMDVPYYHWRQHWVLANRHATVVQMQRQDGTGAGAAQQDVRACERAITDLARAMAWAGPRFTPEAFAERPEWRRAVARALAEADCHKALPIALHYVRQTPRDQLGELSTLREAVLASLRHLHAARVAERR